MFENMQESGLTEIIHLHRSNPGPVSCVFHILRSLELTLGSGCNLMGMRLQVFFSFLSSFRAQEFTVENGTDDDCEILVVAENTPFLGASICLQCRRPGFDPWLRKTPWSRKWQPTPVCLPGEFQGQRSLVGYSPWGHKESTQLRDKHFYSFSQKR